VFNDVYGDAMTLTIRRATTADVLQIAAVHREAFPRQQESEVWVAATLAAAPRILTFVAEQQAARVVGYVFWAQKSGIRPSAVLELDQVAVASQLRGRGIARNLISESLRLVKSDLRENHQVVTSVLVSTRADNEAQRLYAQVLGAKVIASIENLYSGTEVIMLSKQTDA
jgi:ribosomal protein S18 acetylase RimI-like enzyme